MLSALALALADCALPSLPRAARWRRGAEKHCPRGARHPTRPPKKTVTSPAMTPGASPHRRGSIAICKIETVDVRFWPILLQKDFGRPSTRGHSLRITHYALRR